MARISGNDISNYQGDVNYDIYKNNSNFVIVKATEGINFTDGKLSRNQSEARRVNLALGYYHFAHPENDPIQEADYFLSKVGQLKSGEVLCLDYEPPTRIQAHVDWCKKWLDHVFEKTKVKALIYMSESVVSQLDWTSVVNGGYGLWIAKYLFSPSPDATYNTGKWTFAAIYQWTSKQAVPGIVGNVDGDVFYGDVATFKKYGYVEVVAPPTIDWQAKYNQEVALNKSLTDENNSLKQKIQNAKNALI